MPIHIDHVKETVRLIETGILLWIRQRAVLFLIAKFAQAVQRVSRFTARYQRGICPKGFARTRTSSSHMQSTVQQQLIGSIL
jgi:hypothetical protein